MLLGVYIAGQRRLRRTPDLAYDTADINTDSIRTIDQVDILTARRLLRMDAGWQTRAVYSLQLVSRASR